MDRARRYVQYAGVPTRLAAGVDVFGSRILAMACESKLGIVLDKFSQTSNWSRRSLDADQLEYTTLNAEELLVLHERFIVLGVAPDSWGYQA